MKTKHQHPLAHVVSHRVRRGRLRKYSRVALGFGVVMGAYGLLRHFSPSVAELLCGLFAAFCERLSRPISED